MQSHYSSSPPEPPLLMALQDLWGGLVPHRAPAQAQCMHRLEREHCALELWQVRPDGGTWMTWTMGLMWPANTRQCPVLLSPDGCWPHGPNDAAARCLNEHGIALAWFNRTELAFDPPDARRCGPVFERYPEHSFGALSVWAWGLQRCVDVLLDLPQTDPQRLGVIGHSRGGKAALLAGALDARIALTVLHNSGTAGAASLQHQGPGAESLAELAARYPHWLGRAGTQASVQEAMIDMDATALLLSHMAPRGLCLLQARGDAWANPEGTRQTFESLRPHWRAHQAAHRLVLHERDGGHAMTVRDWQAAARFVRALR